METIKQLLPILITLSLAGLVLTVGLNAAPKDLGYVLRRPALLGKAVIAVLIIPPLAATGLAMLLPVTMAVKAGIILMAVAPVPPLVPGKELAVGARKSYAYGLYVAMALLTVISVPIAFNLEAWVFGRDDTVTLWTIALIVAKGVLIPLGLGVLVRRLAPAWSEKAAPIVYKLSMLLLVIAFVPVLVTMWTPMVHLIGNGTLLTMMLLVLICLAGGHLLGGPDRIDRATLAVASSVRHPGIALALASANMTDRSVVPAVLLFLLVGLIVGIPYNMWIKRTARHEPQAS